MALEQQISSLQAAISREPENKDNWIMLGLCALMAGQHDQCVGLFERRDGLFGDGIDLYFSAMVGNVIAENPPLLANVASMPVPGILSAFDAVTVFAIGGREYLPGRGGPGTGNPGAGWMEWRPQFVRGLIMSRRSSGRGRSLICS